ncbi:response regulator [Fulvivirga sp. 29W222]|uniref:Response regulator n=1 Tax=Fulvivirga marina TaxID=2494733 RepID=A0A937FYG0_9BACT|nr:response regulator [Fulvivirga marina]MBL6447298.1 response regulator [Fulvivirga marina]
MDIIKQQEEVSKLDISKRNAPLKVFIVDDDEYFNNILQSYINKIGTEINQLMETQGFLNGSDCLKAIKKDPDYVILDFYLDENNDITLTGYDVLEKIKKYNADIKVIVISQMHEWENFKEEFKHFGASDFLKKDDNLYDNLKEMMRHSDIDLI